MHCQNYAVLVELEQAFDFAIFIDPDGFCGGFTRQARHGHDFAAYRHNKASPSTDPHFTYRNYMASWRSTLIGIGRETILGFAIQTGKCP